MEDAKLGKHYFIACYMKSASSFLTECIRKLTGIDAALFADRWPPDSREGVPELSLESAVPYLAIDTVDQQHQRATQENLFILQLTECRTVVLIRNIFDCMISMTDFMERGLAAERSFYRNFNDYGREQRIDMTIDQYCFWYIDFYASWCYATLQHCDDKLKQRLTKTDFYLTKMDAMWLSFDELTGTPEKALSRLVEYWGIGSTQEDIAQAISAAKSQPAKIRMAQGVSGRGLKELNTRQIDKIKKMASYHKGVDFSPVGIDL